MPMFSSTGSMKTHATSAPCWSKSCSSRGRSLYGTTWTVPASTSNGVTGVGASSGPASATSGLTDTWSAS